MTTFNPDLSKPTCRVCLQNQDKMVASIFDLDADKNGLHIYEKIEQCACINVLRLEKMPTLICCNCYEFLNVAFKFRAICRSSNEYLKEFVIVREAILNKEPYFPNPYIKTEKESASNVSVNYEDCADNSYLSDDEEFLDIDGQNDENVKESAPNGLANYEGTAENSVLREDNEEFLDNDCQNDEYKTSKFAVDIKEEVVTEQKIENIVKRRGKWRKQEESSDQQPHLCDICGKKYELCHLFDLHMRKHRNEKPYECENHRNEKPYKCAICGKSFTYLNVLKRHEFIHTGEKPYACELCGKCFKHAHHLRAHFQSFRHQSDPRSKILSKKTWKTNKSNSVKINTLSKL